MSGSFRDHLPLPGRAGGLGRVAGRGDASTRAGSGDGKPPRKFLSIWFRCCSTYGRAYRNATETSWVARCPRCGARVTAPIGADGSSRNIFVAE